MTISQEEETVGYWENYTDFPEAYSLPQGSYLLTAVYGDISQEGFDLPCFEGSEPFYLVKGETTEVEVTCFLANVKVTTEYTENFRNYFTSYETQVQSVSGNILIFPEGEERAAYIQPGKFTVAVRVTRSGGEAVTMQVATIPEASAREHYKLKLDVDAGSALLNVSFSEETERVPIQIDISDEALNAPAPFFIPDGFESGVELSAVEGSPVQGVSGLSAILNAQGGISQVRLFTQSKALLAIGWPAEVDLLDTDEATLQWMKELGLQLKGLETNVDKMAVIDFSEVISNLQIVEGDDLAVFKLVATDRYSKVTETETVLPIRSIDNGLKISEPDAVNYGSPTALVEVELEGDPDKLRFQYYSFGVWQDALSCRTLSSQGNVHQVEVTFEPELTLDTEIRAVYVRKPSNEVPLEVAPYSFTIEMSVPAEVWATRTYVRFICEQEDTKAFLKKKNLRIQYCKINDVDTWITPEQEVDGDLFTVFLPEDPEKENTYLIRAASMDGTKVLASANTYEITTERAVQIPNSDLETWSSANPVTTAWTYWYVNSDRNESVPGWCTLNAVTTQVGTENLYQTNPGTRRTADASSGSYAAEIVTVGWGATNNQPTSITSSASNTIVENITAGELFLGTIGNDLRPEYGYEISSRPLGVSFDYMFTGKGTPFTVSVEVTNQEEGLILAENTFTGTENTDTYTRQLVPLNYVEAYKHLKPTHISIVFSSGENPYSEMDRAYIQRIIYEISRRDYNTGNYLYIDNIKLEY